MLLIETKKTTHHGKRQKDAFTLSVTCTKQKYKIKFTVDSWENITDIHIF